jgi:hypothetical protein
MKSNINTSRIFKAAPILGGLALLTLVVGCEAGADRRAASSPQTRIGIYDSRAIAVAYVCSTYQKEKMNELKAQFTKAQADGNSNEVAQLEAEGRNWQATLHEMAFGTAPVDDLLVHIAGELPKIQEAAGVTSLQSKWNKPALDQHPRAERVDVTMGLVDAFHPLEIQRRRAIEIQRISPGKTNE